MSRTSEELLSRFRKTYSKPVPTKALAPIQPQYLISQTQHVSTFTSTLDSTSLQSATQMKNGAIVFDCGNNKKDGTIIFDCGSSS